jgi:tetratricopeptide (TPR) repeat protein
VRLRGYNATIVWLASMGVVTAITCVVVVTFGVLARPELVVLALLAWAISNLVAVWALRGNHRDGVRLNNDAVILITNGDIERANAKLHAAVTRVFPRDVAAMALFNQGVVAVRTHDLETAKTRSRESVAMSSGFRLTRAHGLYEGLARAQLAFACAVTGDLDEADACLAKLDEPGSASPLAIAFAVRARATVAHRRGRFEDVVAITDAERALLRNALAHNDAVLAEATRAYALSRLGDAYRAAARTTPPIYADDLARDYVRSMLPETLSVLAHP